eukprot:2104288-Lingulodinium_polyedra.AAC.1
MYLCARVQCTASARAHASAKAIASAIAGASAVATANATEMQFNAQGKARQDNACVRLCVCRPPGQFCPQ